MSTPLKILVIEDDAETLRLIGFFLKRAGYEVYTATDGIAGLRLARQLQPALVVLDWQLPGLAGIDVCRKLRETSRVPVLMLTSMVTVADRVEGLETGADDYMVKPFAPEELVARVAARLRTNPAAAAPANELVVGDLVLSVDAHRATRAGRDLELSPKEFELLHYFMKHPNKVLRKSQLLGEVWGDADGYDSNVVSVYVAYLRQKLEQGGLPRLIQTQRGIGFVLESKP
jgi:DNA-binding response OmpR family regulator